ncbi:hypothetical protein BSKO_07780 [Bryopsis sp. KO-2023]|nr:hypothetical protein BSKO_07780 [Bryopsis sp. KO-2023]
MKVRVKTQDDRTFAVDVSTSSPVRAIKDEVEQKDREFSADRFRVLFQGRFLEDESSASACGISDGHTVLLVPKPISEGRRHRRSASTGGSQHAHLRRVPSRWYDLIQFLQAQHRVLAVVQPGSRGGRGNARPPTPDEEMGIDMAAMETVDWESLVEVREGDTSDLVLGFAFGFLLGPVAGLCLIENALSRRVRAGMLVGIICEVMVALLKMLTHIPTGV